MTDRPFTDEPPSDADLVADEQQILDTALLESDQLLARSLHADQRLRWQRIVWFTTCLIGGVAMTVYALFLLGFFAASGEVSDPGKSAGEDEDITREEDAQWRKRLLSVKEGDSWFDGARLGMELMRMPGDRPYRLLADNWKDISVNARQQILKGFSPGMMGNRRMHPRFFHVMHLGMSDSLQAVRDYAATYLEMQGLPNFAHDPKGYKRWWQQNKKLTASEIAETNQLQLPPGVTVEKSAESPVR